MVRFCPSHHRLGTAADAAGRRQTGPVVNYVLDTNAVSETVRPRPNPGLIDWLFEQDPAHLPRRCSAWTAVDPSAYRSFLSSLNRNGARPVMSELVNVGHQNFSTCSTTSRVPSKWL